MEIFLDPGLLISVIGTAATFWFGFRSKYNKLEVPRISSFSPKPPKKPKPTTFSLKIQFTIKFDRR